MAFILALTLYANTAFVVLGGEYVELCVITVGEQTTLYQGECKDVSKSVLRDVQDVYPNLPVGIVLNGIELNRI